MPRELIVTLANPLVPAEKKGPTSRKATAKSSSDR
jgi:hypothetical protein